MIFLHETHEIAGGRLAEFEERWRDGWLPAIEGSGDARLVWFWEHTHGTGPSYQAVSITAVRDWAAWGNLARMLDTDPEIRKWHQAIGECRREVTSKMLVPVPWSPLQEVDLAARTAAPAAPVLHLHDTGWPFPGKLDAYVGALGSVFFPLTRHTNMISVEACWTTAPGTGRHHEVLLLQRILDWPAFSRLLTDGENRERPHPWMVEGLKHRDRWESKLLRTVGWSPGP